MKKTVLYTDREPEVISSPIPEPVLEPAVETVSQTEGKKSKFWLWILLVLFVLVLAGLLVWWYIKKRKQNQIPASV